MNEREAPRCLLIYRRFSRKYRSLAEKHNGVLPPESRLLMGQIGAILAPTCSFTFFVKMKMKLPLTPRISALFCMAFTTYQNVHWIVPIIASVPFGTAILYIFASTFTYLVTAYRPVAASALAGNSALRSTFAAAFPLFAGAMYDKLGTVGATALLAGLATIMAPLP